jgi:SAM-dependent methyltransferase
MTTKAPDRRSFQGVLQILSFNWPYYAASVCGLIVVAVVSKLRKWPRSLAALVWIGCGGVAWWTGASLVASHWVYDRSPLMKWSWVSALLAKRPRRWVNIHSGLDESTLALTALFPDSPGMTFDIFDEREMSEHSIRRARKEASAVTATPAHYTALPLSDASIDAVFLFFAAHELRAPVSRERLFGEIARVLAPGGRLILAEHTRDAANLAIFGPGFWHFLPRGEWLRLANLSGLKVDRELTITPLVHIWSLEKSDIEN